MARRRTPGVSLVKQRGAFYVSYDHATEIIEKPKVLADGIKKVYRVGRRVERKLVNEAKESITRQDHAERNAAQLAEELADRRRALDAERAVEQTAAGLEPQVRLKLR